MTTPTRGRGSQRPSVIDLVFTNEIDMIDNIDITEPLGASDHAVLDIKFRCSVEEQPPKIVFKYEKTDFNELKEMLDIDWKEKLNGCKDDVDKQWGIYYKLHREAEDKCVPKNVITTNNKKFSVPLDHKTLAKKRKKYKLWKRFMETEDGIIYTQWR